MPTKPPRRPMPFHRFTVTVMLPRRPKPPRDPQPFYIFLATVMALYLTQLFTQAQAVVFGLTLGAVTLAWTLHVHGAAATVTLLQAFAKLVKACGALKK